MTFHQSNLIENIKTYLTNRDRESLAEQMYPGYCRGLTLLFCYFAMNEKLDLFKNLICYADDWKEDSARARKVEEIRNLNKWQDIKIKLNKFISENVLFKNYSLLSQLAEMKLKELVTQDEINFYMSGFNLEDTNMEKLLAQMEFLQSSGVKFKLPDNGSAVEMLNMIKDKEDESSRFTHLFECAAIIPKTNLSAILEKTPRNVSVCMSNGRHAFALYKTDKHYYFCDSNFGVGQFDDCEKMAATLLTTTYAEAIGLDIPFAMEILVKDPNIKCNFDELIEQFEKNEKPHVSSISKILNDFPVEGATACMLAVTSNLIGEVKRQIAKLNSADLNATDGVGLSALHYAVWMKQSNSIMDLIQGGADINIKITKRRDNLTNALDNKGEWLYRSIEGATPLHLACINNDIELVRFLLANKADVNALTTHNLTPLMYAAMNGHDEIVELLLAKGANRDIAVRYYPIDDMKTPSFDNAKKPLEWVGAIRNLNEYDGFNAALCAAKNNHFNTMTLLLKLQPISEDMQSKLPLSIVTQILSYNIWHQENPIKLDGNFGNKASSLMHDFYLTKMDMNISDALKEIIGVIRVYISLREKPEKFTLAMLNSPGPCLEVIERLNKLPEKFEYSALLEVIHQTAEDKKYKNYKKDIEFLSAIKSFLTDYVRHNQLTAIPSQKNQFS